MTDTACKLAYVASIVVTCYLLADTFKGLFAHVAALGKVIR